MYEHILVGVDASVDGMVAAEHAVDLASKYGATLHAVYVIETRTAYDNAIVDPEVVHQHLREEGEQALSTVQALADDAGVSVRASIEEGIPPDVLLEYVTEHDVDFVVVGAMGKSAFKTVLLGSTTEALLRSAGVPVLVVGGE